MDELNAPRGLISEIKLLLQQELSEVKDGMNDIRLQISDLKGAVVMRQDFEIALEAERSKREVLEAKTVELDKQLSGLENTAKIYMAIATTVATILASGVAGIVFSP